MANEVAQPLVLTLSIDEALYVSRWYPHRFRSRLISPSFVPDKADGDKPEAVQWHGVIWAEKLYIQPAERGHKSHPSITDRPIKMLRQASSDFLGPNTYLFAGQVVASERYAMNVAGRTNPMWQMSFVVDCGIPLLFHADNIIPHPEPKIGCIENYATDRAYIEGIARLSASAFPTSGIQQSVSGNVVGMRELDLDCSHADFGRLRELKFGTRLIEDPDFISIDTVFMTFEPDEIGPLAYRPFPARDKDCPEPAYPEMVLLEGGALKIVTLGNANEGGIGPTDSEGQNQSK